MVDFKEMVAEAEKGLPPEYQAMLKNSFRGTSTSIDGDHELYIPKSDLDGNERRVAFADLKEKARWINGSFTTDFYETKDGVTLTVITDAANNRMLMDTFVPGNKKAHHYRYGEQNSENQTDVSIVEGQAPVLPLNPTSPEEYIAHSKLENPWVSEKQADGSEKISISSTPKNPKDAPLNLMELKTALSALSVESDIDSTVPGKHTLVIASKDIEKAREILDKAGKLESNKKAEEAESKAKVEEKEPEKPVAPSIVGLVVAAIAGVLAKGFTQSAATRGDGVIHKVGEGGDWGSWLNNFSSKSGKATYGAMDAASDSALTLGAVGGTVMAAGGVMAAVLPVLTSVGAILATGGLVAVGAGVAGAAIKASRIVAESRSEGVGFAQSVTNNTSKTDKIVGALAATAAVGAGVLYAPGWALGLGVVATVMAVDYMIKGLGGTAAKGNKLVDSANSVLGGLRKAAEQREQALRGK